MAKRELTPNVRMLAERKALRITQQDLAGQLDVSHSWISKIEQGRELPSREFATKLAKRLNADPAYLFPDLFNGQ